MSMEELFNAISEINLLRVQEILYSNQNLNINQVNEFGQNIFHIAARASDGCNGCNLEIFKILISYAKEHGYDRELRQLINAKNTFGDTVIMNVVKNNYNPQEILELLVANGANIHQRNQQGQTALHHARTVKATKALLDNGANLFTVDSDGNTVFHRAAEYGNIDILEFLIKTAKNNGYDQELIQSLNAKNTFGRSVIYNAANEYYTPEKN